MGNSGQLAGAVVLGMHRSGTSAVAGFLAKAGFYAGDDDELLPAAEDNPTGFFERADVNGLNDELLAGLGGAWDKPPPRALVADKAPAWRPKVDEVLAHLRSAGAGRPLVVKDPRIGLTLPAWQPALEQSFAVVLVDRSPMDIALSMRSRDGRPLYVALALWQLYCAELLEGFAGRRALVVRYESFVKGPGAEGGRLLEQLGEVLSSAQMATVDAGRAGHFVSPELRHHRTALKSASNLEVLTGAQLSLARWLAELPEGWTELRPPARLRAQPAAVLATVAEYYDAVADRFGMETAYDLERHKALHFEQATELKDRHIENIEGAIAGLRRQVESQSSRITDLEDENERLRATISSLREELRTLREDGRAAAGNLVALARRSLSGR
ncbi:MAG: hypothetical protein ACRDZX_17270 [Acidimicrobiales bacterium]